MRINLTEFLFKVKDFIDNCLKFHGMCLPTYLHAYINVKAFLVSYLGERPCQPLQRPANGRKKKVKGQEERGTR